MPISTNPRKALQKKDMVTISRKEYEQFLDLKMKTMPITKPTKEELQIFKEGEKAIKKGDFITLEDLKKELGL